MLMGFNHTLSSVSAHRNVCPGAIDLLHCLETIGLRPCAPNPELSTCVVARAQERAVCGEEQGVSSTPGYTRNAREIQLSRHGDLALTRT